MRWQSKLIQDSEVECLSASAGIGRVTATLLLLLGIRDAAVAKRFMQPMLRELEDPFRVGGMNEAVALLRKTMRSGGSIAIFGDYDVDGVTSTVLLTELLQRFGVTARHIVPLRIGEGYGLSVPALERLMEQGRPDLLVAVDCGTNSVDEVRWLRSLGIEVIIIDHHTSREGSNASEDAVLVNPHVRDGEDCAWSQLCSVGLVFKLAHALIKQMRTEGNRTALDTDIRDYLDLAALGTIADLVPLTEENRILTRKGLERLSAPKPRTGLATLYEVAGIHSGQPVTPFDISFRLSPRINASGRMADADMAVELLMGTDWLACTRAARELDRMNTQRQDIERETAAQAMDMARAGDADAAAFVLYNPGWHPGVAGIVASRVAKHFGKPAIILTNEEDGVVKGSGRSAEGVDMVEALSSCAGLLENWGGHPMAVGVGLKPENIPAFQKAFPASVATQAKAEEPEPFLEISCWVEPGEIDEDLCAELEMLGPFGQGNPQPVLGVRGAVVPAGAKTFGSGHCRFWIEAGPGRSIPCVMWHGADQLPPVQCPIDIAAQLNWNSYRGVRTLQLQVEHWRIPARDGGEEIRETLSAAPRPGVKI